MTTSKIRLLGTFICLIFLSFPLWITPLSIQFKSDVLGEIIPVLSFIFVISLFMERTIEVFLSAWRSAEADEQDLIIAGLDADIKRIEDELKKPNISANEIKTKNKKIESIKTDLSPLLKVRTKYRAKSRELALWYGLALGILISAVGVRTLHNFIDANFLEALSPAQSTSFSLVDVLVTGSLLSGGSEAVNKLMKIYTNFTQATAEKAKGKKK